MTTSMALLYLLSITLVVAGSRYLEEEEEEWVDSLGKNKAVNMKKTEEFNKGFDPIPNISYYNKKGRHVAAQFDNGNMVVEKKGEISEEFDTIPNITAYVGKEKVKEEKKSSQRGFQSMLFQPSFMG